MNCWGPYPDYDDIAKMEYGRILWRSTWGRARLLANWTNPDHPHCEQFHKSRAVIEEVLESCLPDEELDRRLRARSLSLRAAVRMIPTTFGGLSGIGPTTGEM